MGALDFIQTKCRLIKSMEKKMFEERKNKAQEIYLRQRTLYCPYFKTEVVLNAEGFHHLQFSANRERHKKAQALKFRLLPLALMIIKNSGTIQEYRKLLIPIGKPSARDGARRMKNVEYWGLTAIVGENKIKVRTILRRIGDGNVTFWSVMPDLKFKAGKQKLFFEGIENE